MILVKRLVLDVLKPHTPNSLEFAKVLAEQESDCRVAISVSGVDEKTETVVIMIEGDDIQFEKLTQAITTLGGSLHSIDEVEVVNIAAAD
jgi:hypothetical protein